MATWQFWTLFTVLVMNFFAVLSAGADVKSLWTKLHELHQAIGSFPRLDYREDLERLGRQLERIENAAYSYHPPSID